MLRGEKRGIVDPDGGETRFIRIPFLAIIGAVETAVAAHADIDHAVAGGRIEPGGESRAYEPSLPLRDPRRERSGPYGTISGGLKSQSAVTIGGSRAKASTFFADNAKEIWLKPLA